MIAGCPKCGARYRVEREKLEAGGVRLRCAKCDAVFRVRAPVATPAEQEATQLRPAPRAPAPPEPQRAPAPPPAAPARPPAPAGGDLVLVAIPEPEVAKRVADVLGARGVRTVVVHDGVDAVLELQRQLPKAAVVAAHLPKMFGFQVCELVKRNASLRETWIVLAGAVHNQERYRRPAQDIYGADAYLEMPDLPDGVLPLLERGGVALEPRRAAPPAAQKRESPAPPVTPPRAVSSQQPPPKPPRPVPAAEKPRRPLAPPETAQPRVADGLEELRAKAERLARIIVSDIVLYNEQKFAAAIRSGNVVEALDSDLGEGRHLFQERIDARVRAERDYLAEELVRVAKQRGMK